VVVRVGVERALCHLEITNSECAGEVTPRAPDLKHGGGLGLQIVQELSERWGLERAAAGGTRVWVYLLRAPLTSQGHGAGTQGVRRVASAT
jgi:hypothetical protein